MSHLVVIIPLPAALAPVFSRLKTIDCQWRDGLNIYLPLRRIGRCSNRVLLEDIDYALSRLSWTLFTCTIKHVSFQLAHDGYKIGFALVPSPDLLRLYQKVNFALSRTGLEIPRKKCVLFSEIGFIPSGYDYLLKDWIEQHSLFSIPTFEVDRIALIEDHSDKTYGQFTLLEEYRYNRSTMSPSYQDHWTNLMDFNFNSDFRR